MHTHPLLPSLYVLLNQIIDYAGLFPPANLTFIEALRNFIHYRTMPEQWMLSRFILPAHRLGDLARLMDHGLTWEGTLSFSILGQGGTDLATFLSGLDADVQAVSTFRTQYGDRVRVEVYETRVPASEMEDESRARSLLGEMLPRLTGAGLSPFLETPFGIGWESCAEGLIRTLAHQPPDSRAGFKLRTGGVTADAFPTPEQIAFALRLCRDQGVPLKCTAGLHHPVRSFREEVGTKMHGFLNVFMAGVLLGAGALEADRVVDILREEDPAGFAFSVDRVGWRGITASVEQVKFVREKQMISFGCCSFEEPKADLEGLGFSLIKS